MPGVHAVFTAADLPRACAPDDPDAGAQSRDQDDAHAARARARRGLLRRPDHRGRDRRQPLSRRRRRGGWSTSTTSCCRRSSDCPRCGQAGRAARARRPCRQHRGLRADDYGDVDAAFATRRMCSRRRCCCIAAAPWRWKAARVLASYDAGDRHAHRVVGDADAASRPRHARRSVRARPRIDPRDRAATSAAASAPRRRSMPRRR